MELTSIFFIGFPSGPELLIVLAVVVLLFGASKLPELARGTGQALRIFKSETRELRREDESGEGEKLSHDNGASDLDPAHSHDINHRDQ